MADDASPFESYGGFLRTAILRYWDRKGSSRVTFLALLFATRQAWSVALEKGLSIDSGKKVLTGAGAVAAGAMLIRLFLGGPLGLLLTGASAVSLLAVYGKNSEAIWKKVPRFHGIIDAYEDHWREVHDQHGAGDMDAERRDLIMEGLVARFLDELDRAPEPEEEEEPVLEVPTGFAAHVAKQRDETPDA